MVTKKSQKNERPFQRRANSDIDALLKIQRELDQLDEVVIDHSVSIPLTRLLIIDKDKLFSQIDTIKDCLPETFEQAVSIIKEEERILSEAEEDADNIIRAAQQRATEILNETAIIQRAELEASRLRQQTEEDCENLEITTKEQVEKWQNEVYQQIDQLRQQTEEDCARMQNEADNYVEVIFNRVEETLRQMLNAVNNVREHLATDPYPPSESVNPSNGNSANQANGSRKRSA